MYRLARMLSIFGIGLFVAASPLMAAPLNNTDEVGAAILACWNPPEDSKGSFVTLSFSFKRDGTLIGPPRPTGISVAGDAQARQQFVDAAIAAVERCLPLEFSPAFAEGVGGQVFTMRFASPKELSVSPSN